MISPSLTGSQNPPCGHLLCSKNSSNPCTIRILDNFGPLLCAPMPCMVISMLTSCENRGIINFPIVKLTIPRGPNLILAPKSCADVLQICILNDSCGYICDLCGSVVTSRNALCPSPLATVRAIGCCVGS